MKRKWLSAMGLLIIGVFLATSLIGCGGPKEPDIKIGGKNFSEQFIMAEMFRILIEENTNLTTSVKTNLEIGRASCRERV